MPTVWRHLLALSLALTLLCVVPLAAPTGFDTAALADDDDDDDEDDDADADDDDDDDDDRRAELILGGLGAEARQELIRRGFRIAATRTSESLAIALDRVEGPPGLSAAAALRLVEQVAPDALRARNDLFRRLPLARYTPRGRPCGEDCETFRLANWQPAFLHCAAVDTIGVIDTRVDTGHPSLAGAAIEVETVRRADRRPSGAAHGTGVVSLLVGQQGSPVVGTLPRARVVAVDAFHSAGGSDATDAFDLVAALDRLAERGIRVVNLSLSGPANPVLEKAIAELVSRGITVVAAAGPSNTQGYPAKYDGVLAVSAVDARLRPSRLSARGQHIAFAGPGVGLIVAAPGGGTRRVDGTSFAAPFVTAALAAASTEAQSAARAAERLQTLAKDLGAPGRDPIFGWGLVQFPDARC